MKVIVDGKCYYLYALLLSSGGFVTGFDPRPRDEVEAEWLTKQATCAANARAAEREVMKANILLSRVQKREDYEEIEDEEIVAPPARGISQDEVLHLSGLPAALHPSARADRDDLHQPWAVLPAVELDPAVVDVDSAGVDLLFDVAAFQHTAEVVVGLGLDRGLDVPVDVLGLGHRHSTVPSSIRVNPAPSGQKMRTGRPW